MVNTEHIGGNMVKTRISLSGAIVSVAEELDQVAHQVAGDFDLKSVERCSVVRATGYFRDGRLVDIDLEAMAHRGRVADELAHYANELRISLADYEHRERAALKD